MRGWRDWVFLAWCIVLLIAAVTALYPGWDTLRHWIAADSAPAWVQALGSIGAILGALAVGNSQIRAGRAQDERARRIERHQRVEIISALLSNAKAVCKMVKDNFDQMPLPMDDATLFLTCRDHLARVDPFMIPSARLTVRVLGVPLQLQRLYDSYLKIERSLGMGPQRGFTEAFLKELDTTIAVIDDAFGECRAATRGWLDP